MKLNEIKWFHKRDEHNKAVSELRKVITQKEKQCSKTSSKWSPPSSLFTKMGEASVYTPRAIAITSGNTSTSTTITSAPNQKAVAMSNRKKKKQNQHMPKNAQEVFEAIQEAEARNNGKLPIPKPIPITKMEPNDQID